MALLDDASNPNLRKVGFMSDDRLRSTYTHFSALPHRGNRTFLGDVRS